MIIKRPTRVSRAALFAIAAVALALAQAGPASADLIFDSGIDDTGAGFGTTDNILTMKQPGGAGTATDVETGKVAWDGTNDVYSGGQVDTNPLKTATYSFADIGLTGAEDLNLIWNPAEVGSGRPNGGPRTDVDQLILTIYRPDGTFFWEASLAAPVTHFAATNGELGVGGIGFVYRLDDTEAFELNKLLGFLTTTAVDALRIGLESSVSFVDNGPDHWTINTFDRPTPKCQVDCDLQQVPEQVPEPQSLLLVAAGLLGLTMGRRRFYR